MRYALRPMTGLLMMLLLTGCVGAPPIVVSRTACAALLPEAWREPVAGAPLPAGDGARDWMVFGDAQTAQLDKANDRTLTVLTVVDRCEARDREAVAKARKRWWQVWR